MLSVCNSKSPGAFQSHDNDINDNKKQENENFGKVFSPFILSSSVVVTVWAPRAFDEQNREIYSLANDSEIRFNWKDDMKWEEIMAQR